MEETKITTVNKVKDPKRVEQGKRLAAISREAKERKARERFEAEAELFVLPVLALTVGVVLCGGGAYHYRYLLYDNKEEPKHVIKKPTPKLEQL